MDPRTVAPLPGETEEAKRQPNGWVYRVAGRFGADERVPPEAIVGAWKVDASGRITGSFVETLRTTRAPGRPVASDKTFLPIPVRLQSGPRPWERDCESHRD
jgi:hypothetical protein